MYPVSCDTTGPRGYRLIQGLLGEGGLRTVDLLVKVGCFVKKGQ